ncbi:MAG TPA: HPr family phosphocarrier protein [Thermoanaerobaculia bacterium]|nr:HPr family phosphocarrier protein [Thermoanaerobaculia bacterium]
MVEREVKIVNRLGLHARAAAKLVHLAGRYQSRVILLRNGEEVDAKSILGVLLLAAGQGSHIRVRCIGEDEEEAMTALTELVAERFGEEN